MNTHKEEMRNRLENWYKSLPEDIDIDRRWKVSPDELEDLILSGYAAPLEPKKTLRVLDDKGNLIATREVSDETYEQMLKVEPTPPSQIEEESQTQRSLREMYELGKEHGRTLALKDMEIERLIKETEEML